MHPPKVFLISICVLLISVESLTAQRSRNVTHSRYKYSTPKVRGHKARIICPVFQTSSYPYHGMGFKLGDPFALTYKFYPNKRFSLAVDVGKPASGLYSAYFSEKFAQYVNEGFDQTGVSNPVYVTHRVRQDLVAELKFLYHLDAETVAEGLQLYAGAGWAWRYTHLVYDFEVNADGPDAPQADPFGTFERHRRTMGPKVTAGIEYSYFRIPVAAFMEIAFFTDTQADPGFQRFEGGVGLRYVF